MMPQALPRLLLTAGEPAGVGPELVVRLAASDLPADLVACSDAGLLARAAERCGLALVLEPDDGQPRETRLPGTLRIRQIDLPVREVPGRLERANADFVLASLAAASDACLARPGSALVTAPLHKGIINDANTPFTGHTEFLAARTGSEVVMMLASESLRVALVTTHLPLARVPAAITRERLRRTLGILHRGLRKRFGIASPRIAVLGLNPHAGEGGHLGSEELDVIEPVLADLRLAGMQLLGPLPADTAFVPERRTEFDAVLAMYHDQALPVLKAEAFDRAINITLGLPFVRTSPDHGTALDLAGRNHVRSGSFFAAAREAARLAAGGTAP